MKKPTRLAVQASCLLLALAICAAAGRMIVVPKDFPTIHAALGEADAGDTIFVSKGIYRENIALSDNVVLQGEDMLATVIDGGRQAPCVVGADGAVIRNFTIRNGIAGVLCKNTRPIIERNLIIDNKGAGIHALISLPDINNNVIYRNEWTGIFLESVRSTRTAIDHNVVLENGYCGIFCAHRTEVLVRNNILVDNKQYGIFVAPEAHKTRIINNNIHGNRVGWNGEAVVQPNNQRRPPQFSAPGYPTFNYYVKSSSPCKGKGENGTDIGLITAQMVVAMSSDRDGDGVPDEADQCPDVPEDRDGFEDEDGCPDYDNDKDGIYDAQDECPNIPEDRDGFQDLDGCPDYDNDMDGIPDSLDKCPNQPETFNNYKDSDGCPDEPPQEIRQSMVLSGVNFKTASAELLEESFYSLEKVFNSLEAFPNARVEIAGHTDNRGSDSYNMALSADRAKSVMNYLVQRGIDPGRITAKGYGKLRPIATNDTPAGRAKNRRVEVVPVK